MTLDDFMASLLFLDDTSWWTSLGNFIKYGAICIGVILGVRLFTRSRNRYRTAAWLQVVVLPLFLIGAAEFLFGKNAIFRSPNAESVWVYVWVFVALSEFAIVWIPIAGGVRRVLASGGSDDVA